MDLRETAQTIFQAALKAVDGRRCTANWLRRHVLEGPVWVVAVGKAAAAMAEGACQALGPQLQRGLLVTKYGHLISGSSACRVFAYHEAGHPVSDAASLRAGRLLLDFVRQAPPQVHWLFLISGGASSLVEALPEGLSLEDLQRTQQWLIGSGLAIADVNRIRRALSLIKGGRLAAWVGGHAVTALLISDVPDDDPAVIGSGLLKVVAHHGDLADYALPDWLSRQLAMGSRAPEPDDPALARVQHHIVASLDQACQGGADSARQLGLEVAVSSERLVGDATEVGLRLGALTRSAAPGVHIWGGETTVTLPQDHGRGGRCQQLALAAALELQDAQDTCLLAAGTDGTDGPTFDAGGIVDGGTARRGRACGMSLRTCLARADAGTFLAATGDLLRTGPTGTNVTDLVVAVKSG